MKNSDYVGKKQPVNLRVPTKAMTISPIMHVPVITMNITKEESHNSLENYTAEYILAENTAAPSTIMSPATQIEIESLKFRNRALRIEALKVPTKNPTKASTKVPAMQKKQKAPVIAWKGRKEEVDITLKTSTAAPLPSSSPAQQEDSEYFFPAVPTFYSPTHEKSPDNKWVEEYKDNVPNDSPSNDQSIRTHHQFGDEEYSYLGF